MADIFISYAAVDRQRVHSLVAEFEAQGYSVWWDPRIGIGNSFDREIERELDEAKCVVVVWSESAVESEWVRNESQEGLDRSILVPVRIDDAKPPLAFRRVQTADLSDAGFNASTMGGVLDAIAQTIDKTHHSASMQTISPPASITDRAPSDATDINQTSSKTKRRVLQITLVTCLLGVLGVTGAWWFANRTTPSSVVLPSISDTGKSPSLGGRNPLADARFSKITDFPGSEFHAAISPDGQFVVFISDRDGPFEVFLSQIDTGGVSDVSSSKEEFQLADDIRSPVRAVGFSGDGTEIWYRSMAELGRLRAMPLLGGAVHTLLGEKAVTPAWSPDGQYIAYHEQLPGDPVHVVGLDGSTNQMILEASRGMHQHFPTWSVDSQWLYLVRGRPSLDMSLWRVRPDGSEVERLTWTQHDVRYPAPIDERTVIYSALDSDGAGPWLWAVDVETKISARASLGLEQYSSVAASANGHRLVATLQTSRAELWSVPILDRVATESDAKTLAEVPSDRAFAPRLHGSWLFYLASRGSGDGLWRLRDGKSEEIWRGSVTPLLEPAAISPDGGSVALILRGDNRRRVHILSSDGATRRALTGNVDVRGAPEWSPDGQWIVVGGIQDGVSGLYKLPVVGGAAQLIVGGEALNPVWSPTGDLIFFAGAEVGATATLRAVRPDGVSVEIPEILVLHNGERMRFLPDGSGLVYMKGRRSVQDFWLLDIATMKDRQLTQLDAGATMRTFDITPDASKIVFDRLIEDSDIVLIERGIKD